LSQNGLPIDERLIVECSLDQNDAMKVTAQLMQLAEKPDAIFAVTDPVAIGAHITIRKYGFKIPEQISLMGFTNDAVSEIIEPSISTMAQPSYEMGRIATTQLIHQIKNKTAPLQHLVLKTSLIVRNSTRIL